MGLLLRLAAACAAVRAAAQLVVTLSVNDTAPLNVVDKAYVAFNIDTGSLYNGMDFGDAKLRTLVSQLAPSVIRIGGTAVDSSFYFPDAPYNVGAPNQCRPPCPNGSSDIGNAMLDAVFTFAAATDMQLLWDVNGETFRVGSGPWDPAGNATAMLAYLDSKHGGRVQHAYSVGNEPDLWKAPHTPTAATLAGDAVTLARALGAFDIGRDVYGASWARISTADAAAFLPVAAAGGVRGMTVHNYPYGGRDCVVASYLNKSAVTAKLGGALAAVAAVARGVPGAATMLLVLEETAGSSGGGCDGVTDRFVAGFCWLNTLNTVGRSGFHRVHRQDIAGWSFAFGKSNYQLVGPPGWVQGSAALTPHPDYFTTILFKQLVGQAVLGTTAAGDAAARAAFDGSFWCAAPRSPYGRGGLVLAWTNSGAAAVTLALPAALAAAPSTRFVLSGAADGTTPPAALTADAVYLNGALLTVLDDGQLPVYPLPGAAAAAGAPLTVPARTYGFVAFDAPAPACAA